MSDLTATLPDVVELQAKIVEILLRLETIDELLKELGIRVCRLEGEGADLRRIMLIWQGKL